MEPATSQAPASPPSIAQNVAQKDQGPATESPLTLSLIEIRRLLL